MRGELTGKGRGLTVIGIYVPVHVTVTGVRTGGGVGEILLATAQKK